MSKRGERGILREARDDRELRDEGRRKIKLYFFLSPPSRKMPLSPRLFHKALTMGYLHPALNNPAQLENFVFSYLVCKQAFLGPQRACSQAFS